MQFRGQRSQYRILKKVLIDSDLKRDHLEDSVEWILFE